MKTQQGEFSKHQFCLAYIIGTFEKLRKNFIRMNKLLECVSFFHVILICMLLFKSVFQVIHFLLFYLGLRSHRIPKIALIWQENQRYRRYFKERNITLDFNLHEKWFIHTLFKASKDARKYFTLVSPETILFAWKKAVADYWNNTAKRRKTRGRPKITKQIRECIRDLKIENYLWGCFRIQDELKKLDYDVSRETIRKVIADYRKSGEIKANLSWKKFLTAQWESLFACDFFTVDLFGFKQLYVFFIIELKSRKIVHWNCTRHPNIPFLQKQLSYFSDLFPSSHLIHDNSGELKWFPYETYGIKGVAITPYSPNMNAYAERFVRSVRQECLDWFIVFNETQLRKILKEYVGYYNSYRPHQGIGKIPDGELSDTGTGAIKKKSILFGLHHHYYRDVC